ncbi:DUF5367 family protein [Paenibacillus ehimensis]|uniref:DUF5367 family protein n=1 Tax=Paenibacillus ehimensis TaxID=79264 RepID=UPI002DBA3CF6|nr:DUF5367 family protein [Paenibacillus ehimensis]MEC0207996.1 DUF5367 family protein [Paenibacillus ehimensis]
MPLFAVIGFVVWLAATVVFRLWGAELLMPHTPLLWVTFIGVVPVVAFLLKLAFAWGKAAPADRPLAALLMALPGMLLDIVSTSFHRLVFPAIPASGLYLFSAWLLWAYSLILLGGILQAIRAKYRVSSKQNAG